MDDTRAKRRRFAVNLAGWVPIALASALAGIPVVAVAAVVLLVLVGWWSWPGRQGRHVSHARALAEADPEDVIVYWRPG